MVLDVEFLEAAFGELDLFVLAACVGLIVGDEEVRRTGKERVKTAWDVLILWFHGLLSNSRYILCLIRDERGCHVCVCVLH